MPTERRADPDCPHCHGSGVVTTNTSFLDRVDETTVICRCMSSAAVAVDISEDDTLVMKPHVK